jgi:hypothetical protein
LNPLKKIQIKIQLITPANYKPKIIDGAKLNLGILGKKQEGIPMCCMSTQIQIKFSEIPHFEIKQILRMLQWLALTGSGRPGMYGDKLGGAAVTTAATS